MHAHDSHAAPAAAWVATAGSEDAFFRNTASLVTIHNLPYMGNGAGAALAAYGFPVDGEGLPEWARGSLLPVGIAHADEISTVSPTYAREILTPEYGRGLDGLLRSRADRLSGILNGLDLDAWDPSNDPAIARPFDASRLSARRENKAALRQELSLEGGEDAPLLAIASGSTTRRASTSPARSGSNRGPVSARTGDLAPNRRSPASPPRSRCAMRFRFDAGLPAASTRVRRLLIPSRYEPCGLTQMIAMRYGSVPVARETGGLADTIRDAAHPDGTGFLFQAFDPSALDEALARALATFGTRDAWQDLMRRGMARDLSWSRSALAYGALYERARARRRRAGAGAERADGVPLPDEHDEIARRDPRRRGGLAPRRPHRQRRWRCRSPADRITSHFELRTRNLTS